MDSSFLLTIFIAALGFFLLYRIFRFEQENNSSYSSLCLASPLPSPSLSHNWTIDVFVSFRGEDVRKDILSHFQKAFERVGIDQFNDNEMERGESISFQLVSAIRGSRTAIILFSKNYASSKWCLDELVEIMKCRREVGQIVLPIFYQVDPSDVRKQIRGFGEVFRKTCAGRTNEEIRRWIEALAEVSTIAGYHSNNWNNEAAMVENIETDVSQMLRRFMGSIEFVDLLEALSINLVDLAHGVLEVSIVECASLTNKAIGLGFQLFDGLFE